jgi:hypothetical protein
MRYEIYVCDLCGKEGKSLYVMRQTIPHEEVSSGVPRGWKYVRRIKDGQPVHQYVCSKECLIEHVGRSINLICDESISGFWVIGK